MGHLSQRKPEQVIGDISTLQHENDFSCEIGYVLGKAYWGTWDYDRGLESCFGLFLFYSSRFQEVKARYVSLNPAQVVSWRRLECPISRLLLMV